MLSASMIKLIRRSKARNRIDDTEGILFTRVRKFNEELRNIVYKIVLHGHQMKKIDTGHMSVEDEVKFIKEITGMER